MTRNKQNVDKRDVIHVGMNFVDGKFVYGSGHFDLQEVVILDRCRYGRIVSRALDGAALYDVACLDGEVVRSVEPGRLEPREAMDVRRETSRCIEA